MEFLSDDPTYLVGLLAFVSAILFVVLRITQQGKFLILALGTAGLALAVLLIEWLWVTDAERVEQSVYALAKAVNESNPTAALEILSEDVQYVAGDNTMDPLDTREMVKRTLQNAKFDFLRITRLRTKVAAQSRRATADFHVIASGSFKTPINDLNFGSANSSWSLAFKEVDATSETGANRWKVTRITPVYVPGGTHNLPTYKVQHSAPGAAEFGNPRGNIGPRGRSRNR